MAGLRVELTGREDALLRIGAIAARLDNAAPMYDAIGDHLELSIDRNFEFEKTPDGNPWPKSLRALATGGKTLTDSARLKQSITRNASASGVEVGTNVEYAAIQQKGGTITAKTAKGLAFSIQERGSNKPKKVVVKSVKIPARPFIGLDDADEAEIILIAEDFIGGSDAR